jgi:hypothetical protein
VTMSTEVDDRLRGQRSEAKERATAAASVTAGALRSIGGSFMARVSQMSPIRRGSVDSADEHPLRTWSQAAADEGAQTVGIGVGPEQLIRPGVSSLAEYRAEAKACATKAGGGVIREGWLYKKGGKTLLDVKSREVVKQRNWEKGGSRKWKQRYFVLFEDGLLRCFDSAQPTALQVACLASGRPFIGEEYSLEDHSFLVQAAAPLSLFSSPAPQRESFYLRVRLASDPPILATAAAAGGSPSSLRTATPPSGKCFKQKPKLKTWPERFVRIEHGGLYVYAIEQVRERALCRRDRGLSDRGSATHHCSVRQGPPPLQWVAAC